MLDDPRLGAVPPEPPYDSILVLYFGGPEQRSDVMPFLRHVTRGRNVPDDRLEVVAEHYALFGGRSPINDQARQMVGALRAALEQRRIDLPVFWGNRNWHPFVADTVRAMADAGHRRAIVYASSAFSSYPGCRQYLEDLESARIAVGPSAPLLDKLPPFWDQPGFLEEVARAADRAARRLSADSDSRRAVVFTAHSIPADMAETSAYEEQLHKAAELVASRMSERGHVSLAYQSRSGPPSQPWLEPDISDHLTELAAKGIEEVVVVPIGFLSDHMEVVYDLDRVAALQAEHLGLRMERASTVGTSPHFVSTIADLVAAAVRGVRPTAGLAGAPVRSYCHPGCCPGHRHPVDRGIGPGPAVAPEPRSERA